MCQRVNITHSTTHSDLSVKVTHSSLKPTRLNVSKSPTQHQNIPHCSCVKVTYLLLQSESHPLGTTTNKFSFWCLSTQHYKPLRSSCQSYPLGTIPTWHYNLLKLTFYIHPFGNTSRKLSIWLNVPMFALKSTFKIHPFGNTTRELFIWLSLSNYVTRLALQPQLTATIVVT